MKKLVLFTILNLLATLGKAQTSTKNMGVDSLLKVLKTAKQDTFQVNTLDELCWKYIKTGDFALADSTAKKAERLAKKLNFKRGLATTLNALGVIYREQGNYPTALDYYLRSLKIIEETGNQRALATSLNNIGIIYNYQNELQKALDYFSQALKIREKIDDKKGVVMSLTTLGVVYRKQGDFSKALDFYSRALKISEEIGDKNGIANALNNMGNIYHDQGDYEKAQANDLRTLKINQEIGNKYGIAICFVNIGSTYLQTGNTKLAIEYENKALELAKKIEVLELVKEANQLLSEAYEKSGQHEKALKHYKDFIVNRDSLFNEENTKKMVESEMNFEFEKKEQAAKLEQEKKDAIALEEQQKQKIIRNSFIGGFGLLLLLSVIIFRSYRNKKKANELINMQKQEVEQQKHIIEEKHKEITDSINYAERIQRSFIASKKMLDENLNEYFVMFKPKDIVSGDFYWAAKLHDDKFALVTADSTGHGVPGAIMSLLNITSLEKAIESYIKPSDILNSTRKTIIERLKKDGSQDGGKDGMDASLSVFDFKNNKVTIAAANNPVWIVRSSNEAREVIEVKPDKMPIGKHDKQDIPFSQQEFDLKEGDVIYTLTDGFPDQFGGETGKKFMSKNLRELLVTNAHLPMNEQKELLQNTFAKWIGNMEQVDDVTVIGVRIT